MKRKILISLVLSSILIEPAKATNFFFKAMDSSSGSELWKSDGTESGTNRVKDIYIGATGSDPENLRVVGDTLFFSANDGIYGNELWKSDGTEAGTTMVKDIYVYTNNRYRTGIGMSYPSNLTALGNTLFFSANDGMIHGTELWKSDGTEAGTIMVKDIWSDGSSSSPENLVVFNNKIYFSAMNSSEDRQLWVSDGSESGTTPLKDIYNGGNDEVSNLIVVNDALFFSANNGSSQSIWKSDGTANGTVQIGTISSIPSNFTNVNGKLYFSVINNSNIEIWRSAIGGAGRATYSEATSIEVVKSIATGYSTATSPSNFTAIGDSLFFSADGGSSYGNELWKSDGTSDGTDIVKDIYAGSSTSSPANLTALGDTLYFSANDGNAQELWESNGSADGTLKVKDKDNNNISSPTNLKVIDNILYFSATTGSYGNELWKSDGTSVNTFMLKDIYSGSSSSYPSLFTKYAIVKASIDITSHSFGNVEVGTSLPQTFTISNGGNLDLSINSISLSDNSNFILNSNCSTIAVGSSCQFTINYSPTSANSHNGVVTINTNASNGSDLTILLNGSGYSAYIPEDINIIDTTTISEEDFGNTFFEDEETFNTFIDDISENFDNFDNFKEFLNENLNYSIPKDAKLSFNEEKNFVIEHPSESFEDGSKLNVNSEIVTSGEKKGVAQTSVQLTSESNEEIATATFETNKDVNVKVANGEVTNSVNTQIEMKNRVISKANLSANIKSTRKELSTQINLRNNSNLNLERESIIPTIGDSNTKIDKTLSDSITKVEIENFNRSSKLQSTRKEFFQIRQISNFKSGEFTISANLESEETLLRGKLKTTKQVALFSTRREFSNVKLEVLFDDKNARELREKQKVSNGKFKAIYSTRSEFSFKSNNLREVDEIKIIPNSYWQRYEEIQNFDGTRNIKLVLGIAKIVIDGKEEEMIKEKLYPLPPIEFTESEPTIEGDIYKDGKFYLTKGWNLIATPVNRDINTTDLNATYIWSYMDRKWSAKVDTLTPQFGYWVNMDKNYSMEISGENYSVDLKNLKSGWSLLGSGESFEVNISNIFKYRDNNWSINPSIIYQGEGFWIKK